MKLALGIPHLGPIGDNIFDQTHRMAKPEADGSNFRIIRVPNQPIDAARNTIIRQTLEWGADWLATMDTDQTFPVDWIPRLLAHDLPIVSGLYITRLDAHPYPIPLCFRWAGRYEDRRPMYDVKVTEVYRYLKEGREDPLEPSDMVGAGCLLVRRDVLESVPWPWYRTVGDRTGTEDGWFSRRAIKAGFQPQVDLSVQCGHLSGRGEVTVKHFVMWYEAQLQPELEKRREKGLPEPESLVGVRA